MKECFTWLFEIRFSRLHGPWHSEKLREALHNEDTRGIVPPSIDRC